MKTPALAVWPLLALETLKLVQGIYVTLKNLQTTPLFGELLFAGEIVVILIGLVALWAMRRWGWCILVGLSLLTVIAQTLAGYAWQARYPLLGPWVAVILLAIFALPSLFAWKRMTWAPLGFNTTVEAR